MFKSGFVGIVGRANVGKSTLLNALLGQKISIVSDKPQTTRNRIQGVLNRPDGQIVFVDTPGMHKPKNELDNYMKSVIEDTLQSMDLVMMLIDASAGFGPGDQFMLGALPKDVPAILLLNKIDLVSQEEVQKLIDEVKELYPFKEILAIQATSPETCTGLIDRMFSYLDEGPMYYSEHQWTNLSERMLVSEVIREKALLYLDQEVPHGIAVVIEEFTEGEGRIDVIATIIVERESHKAIVIGKGARKLKGIGKAARVELEAMFDCKVRLDLWVKVKERWRESAHYVEDYGYKR
ncbi:GTPase Era [Guggenheimella bovis]